MPQALAATRSRVLHRSEDRVPVEPDAKPGADLPRPLHWAGVGDLDLDLRRFLSARCRDATEIDDIVQETLLRVARYRRRLAEPQKLLPWARRIALNVLCDRVRRERRIDRVGGGEAMLDGLAAAGPAPGSFEGELEEIRCGSWVLDKDAALEVLARGMVTLRREDRDLLRSFYGGSGSCREIAASCEVPAPLVKVRLFRARKRLLRAMRRRLALEAPRGCRLEA